MNLKRISQDHSHEAASVDFKPFSAVETDVYFHDFGAGTERFPDFHARFKWEDVERLLIVFAKAGHPKALKMQRSIALAEAVKALMANDEQVSTPKPDSD